MRPTMRPTMDQSHHFLPLTLQTLTTPFSTIRTSLRSTISRSRQRRSASSSSQTGRLSYRSYSSTSSTGDRNPIETINEIVHRSPSIQNLEEEKRMFGLGMDVLEPRPVVYWGGLEERIQSF